MSVSQKSRVALAAGRRLCDRRIWESHKMRVLQAASRNKCDRRAGVHRNDRKAAG